MRGTERLLPRRARRARRRTMMLKLDSGEATHTVIRMAVMVDTEGTAAKTAA